MLHLAIQWLIVCNSQMHMTTSTTTIMKLNTHNAIHYLQNQLCKYIQHDSRSVARVAVREGFQIQLLKD